MFDEMSVRKGLHLRQSDMLLLGKVDHGDQTRPQDEVKDGDHVLVFLFRPFLGGWSQTIGTFCTSGATPGSILAKLILQCVVNLANASVLVQAITCDNSTTNQAALRALGMHYIFYSTVMNILTYTRLTGESDKRKPESLCALLEVLLVT